MKTVDKGVRVDQDLTGKTHSLDRWKKRGGMGLNIFGVL
jgi:hypothetical protein